MRRRERPVPAGASAVPPELERFVFDEWNELPDEPPLEFVQGWHCQMGTKGTLAQDWADHRYLVARVAHMRTRHAWEVFHGLGWWGSDPDRRATFLAGKGHRLERFGIEVPA